MIGMSGRVTTIVLALGAALALAILAAHPRWRRIEERLGVTVLVSSGIPFLALGAVFSLPAVGILTPQILDDLRPAFDFGLGWIGFVAGTSFDLRRLEQLPRGLGSATTAQAVAPMITTAIACTPVLFVLGAVPGGGLVRDVLVLTACAAASAPTSAALLARRLGGDAARLVAEITDLDEVGAFAMLGFVAIFFRPGAGATQWTLPPSAWLLVSLGLGATFGVVAYVLVRGARTATEQLALLIGAVALAAGVAGYLALSVPVICAIAGALLANLPLRNEHWLHRTLVDVERPLYLIFLVVVGASWRPLEWQGWVLAPVFVMGRVYGKVVGARIARRVGPRELPPVRPLAYALMPQSPVAIVVIVTATLLPGGDGAIGAPVLRWAANAIILGSVLTEIIVRLLERLDPGAAPQRATDASPPPPLEPLLPAAPSPDVETAPAATDEAAQKKSDPAPRSGPTEEGAS